MTKWTRFLLLLFLIPNLIYASSSYYLTEYNKDVGKISAEWKRHEELVQQFNRFKLEEKEQNIGLLRESIACCDRAIKHCDHILKKIGEKSHDDKKQWKNEKKLAEQDKNNLNTAISNLQGLINNTIAFSKAVPLYQESAKKANLAVLKNKDCARRLNNVEEVVSTLNEVCKLYEEALSLARNALNLISPYPDEESKNVLRKVIEDYQVAANKYKKEAADWPASVAAQKNTLKIQVATLKEDSQLFIDKGLKRSSYELQKQAVPILEQLVESSSNEEADGFKEEIGQLKVAIAAFEKEAESSRLTEIAPLLSNEDFMVREKERRDLFFKNDLTLNPELFLQSILHTKSRPFALPLDGSIAKKDDRFTLYAEQFYRFLIQSDAPVPELVVTVYKKGEIIHEEVITLPLKNTPSWERYLVLDGMTFIPETKLKTDFGLDLRLSFVCDPRCNFSMMIAQKCGLHDYQFSFSLKDKVSLYACDLLQPPPWQLECLRKPVLGGADRPIDKKNFSLTPVLNNEPGKQLENSFPILDQFVDQLKKDPLALAAYVYNEIELDNRLSYQEEDIFHAPGIQRNACMTFLERLGSPWEQCQLLVYLLRKACYPSLYVTGTTCSLPKAFLEKLLLTKLPTEQKEGLVNYPWVIFFDGKEWVSLFPWMKEMQVHEGHDLYNLMPEEYASADRWILRYLKEDERILKHIGSDKDDTLGVLFTSFVKEELTKQGLSLSDVGIHQTQVKKQFSSWPDFSRPQIRGGTPELLDILNKDSTLFAKAQVEIFSHENPQKKISQKFSLVDLNCNSIPLRFIRDGNNRECLHANMIGEKEERLLDLDESDRVIDIKVYHENFIGHTQTYSTRTISMDKGTEAALCFHLGGSSPKVTSQFYEQFSSEKEEKKRLYTLLAFVGAAYFEKCGRAEKILASLHKTSPVVDLAFGLTKLSTSPTKGKEDLKAPQVDMMWFLSPLSLPGSTFWQQEIYSALRSLESLLVVDSSSNEHQILLDVFGVKEAVSTVKLLQLANRQQQKKGLPEPGFLSLTPSNITTAENTPEAAAGLYFPQLKDLDLRQVKAASSGQWDFTKKAFVQGTEFDAYAYAYMTPGLVFSQEGSYKEMGTLLFHPLMQGGLISSNNLLLNGGLGSPLPSYYFAPSAINTWQLVPNYNTNTFGYTLYVPPSLNTSPSYPNFTSSPPLLPVEKSSPGTNQCSADVRLEHKPLANRIGDPVDVVTGSFYIDEVDLSLPGPFPLEIRRNYNSQNPLIGDLGIGWKLSLNPSLIKQDGKLYAAEADGTVIAYSYNRETSRWEVFPEDNPDLYNLSQKGIGSTSNPFHAYIENDILYGSDGSKRIFEDGFLKKWINSRGNILEFSYNNDKLSRIESSNGDFCGLLYNHEGKISEIYAKDGRRISYNYNSQGDLVKVTLPNSAVVTYEYDHSHRIIRETKPHGKVLENKYEDGKVKKQHSPMGPQQQMIISAKFDYQDGVTIVTDAKEGTTTYKIFEKQIYKIIDPLGYETLQAWFIDEESWFDPKQEKVVSWNQPGGATRCLKSSTDKRGLTTYYLYDGRGNPVEIGLKGEDLTGSGESLTTKKFVYNDRDLCIQEEVLGQKSLTTYDTTFPYLPKKIKTYSGNTLISYVDLEYNSLGQIEKEERSGSITLWKYDARGFPRQKIQVTGTDDPDVITAYSYNNQGQCIELRTADGIQENDHDIMGNTIQSMVVSPSGALLSATYIGYNLNNEPIWKQTANSQNILYIDYHASGLVKASRQSLYPTKAVAYTLYDYDPRGYLIEEVDPLGYTTYRDYNALGNVICETKEGLSTLFTYESGGLPETITSPSGAKTTRLYTTNGLLKEEIYPDGTRNSIVYDHLGRSVLETKNNISWEIKYDDPHHRVTRTNTATKTSEIREFDARGNLIRFTDAAGYTSEKTYDGLNRLKTDTSPSGEQTVWSYQGDTVICSLPSGEKQIQRYEGGCVVASEVVDARGSLIASSSYSYDPETDIKEVVQGEEVTTTWMNAFGLPIKVQKGNITTTYEYDFCGNCIAVADGDGRTTRQTFDSLRRMTEKELPDGSLIVYAYDPDSNLTEYHLPNGSIWTASYDSMGRKYIEELRAGRESSQRWEYTYENGYLKEAKDPMQRIHTYQYEPSGRLAQETVDGGHRAYTYDPRGLLATAEEVRDSNSSWLSSWVYGSNGEHSLVERIYDADGRLSLESIHLNSNLIQQTKQTWEASSRSLQIGDHTRDFIYQNNRLTQVSTGNIDLAYNYDLSGSLKSKSTPLSTVVNGYNASGLPENIRTSLPDGSYQESLEWYTSGRLFSYSSPGQQKRFTYTTRGYLQAAGTETYDFDFGTSGIGIRTAAPGWIVPQNGLDTFGKILAEIIDKNSLATTYNPMGQAIIHNQRQLEWDPWGKLIKVSDGAFTWEASYDALGRRLQTRYTPGWSSTLTTTSFYDPEEEFQEIGVKYGDKTFWKIYGPNTCDAVTDEAGASVVLMHNALDQLAGVVSRQGTVYSEQFPSSYGPQSSAPSIPSDLLSYAQSLSWHSKPQDPTGLIWMGARYYEPKGGRFLSPDPIGYPICLDLYAYAGGDPVNYVDPDGRCFSSAYQSTKSTVLNVKNTAVGIWYNPYVQGGFKATTGFFEASAGAALAPTPFAPLGAVMVIHGADRFSSGLYTAMTGRQTTTLTSQLLQKTGMSPERADRWDDNANFLFTLGGGGLAYKFAKGTTGLTAFSPKITDIAVSNERALLNFTDTAGKHMFEVERRVPMHILDKVIKSPMAVTRDPQGASNAMMYYSQVWKNGKLYNVEVLYDKATNTISHFQYTQKPIGPLTKVSK